MNQPGAPESCAICQKPLSDTDSIPILSLRNSLHQLLTQQIPDANKQDHICFPCYENLRSQLMINELKKNERELTKLDKAVMEKLQTREFISMDTDAEINECPTFGEKLSDKIASFGGSWSFIISFGFVLLIWIAFNSFAMTQARFDPYPFILLNLVLSSIAALQAPVIMMSQNRQEAKDRIRSQHDYMVNLKAEIEIRALHEKMDHLLRSQMHTLMEFQEAQLELLQKISNRP